MPEEQCIFCQIASGAVSARKVYEDEQIICVLDINPANPGHVLIIPKDHYSVLPQFPDELIGHVGKVIKHMSLAMLKSLGIQGTTTFIANGAVAGQRAPHIIIHLIPRAQGDGVFPQPQVSQKRPVSDKADLDKITEVLSG
ncbi:HIT family protein [Candidatus Woesearchaeota archaeon]|nr:HIT family protein [Candidatus Woesearchaeota archaeon]